MAETLYTVNEVQRQLHLSRRKLYELITSGELPSLRIGRARRIPASAVETFIADRLEPTGDAA